MQSSVSTLDLKPWPGQASRWWGAQGEALRGLRSFVSQGNYRLRKGEREGLGLIKKVELLGRRLTGWTGTETNSPDPLTEPMPSQRDYEWAGSPAIDKSEQNGPRGTFPFWLEFFSPQNPWEVAGQTPQTVCRDAWSCFSWYKGEKTQAETCLPTLTRAETSGHVQPQTNVCWIN